jgi:hypothetical protein
VGRSRAETLAPAIRDRVLKLLLRAGVLERVARGN